MIPIPDLNGLDVVFSNAKHLPKWDDIPELFRDEWSGGREPHCKFVSDWFYGGRTAGDMNRLTAKDGVDHNKALAAVKAALASWEPQHEHKIAGCGYLLSEWFDLAPEPKP